MRSVSSLATAAAISALVVAPASQAAAEVTLDWSGFVTAAYTFNFDEPADDTNHGRIFDQEDNTFQVPLAELAVTGGVEDGPSFNLVLEFGDVADNTRSVGLLDDPDFNGFDIQQANVSYKGITFGKFATLIGAEVIESPSNMNYSRSWLFGLAIPFTHTGLMYQTEVGGIGLAAAIVNGWDNFEDNNDSKSFMGQVAVPLGEKGSISVQGIYGAEGDDNEHDMRGVIDVVASFSPSDAIDLVFNADYGSQENVANTGEDADWWGAAAYIDAMITESFGVATRAEFFSDSNEDRGGLGTDGWEVTVTGHQAYGDNALARLEARYDQTAADIFVDGDGKAQDNQITLAAELIFTFP